MADAEREGTLHFLSAGAAQGLVLAVQPAFEQAQGCTLQGRFGAVGAMKEALLAGTPCDLFVSTAKMIGELLAEGRLLAGSATPLGRVRTGVAAREGDAAPDISTAEDLAHALAAAPAIYFPDPERATAGIHFARVLAKLGLAEVTRGRWRTPPNGAAAMRELAAGPAGALGCTQQSEILIAAGVRLIGPLPERFELATVYSAAVANGAALPERATAFIASMTDAAQSGLRKRCGFEP